MTTLGSIGEKLDLLCKQGSTLGFFDVVMRDSAGVPIDLTNKIIRGQARKTGLSTDVVVNIVVQVLDAAGGRFRFGVPDEVTATLPAGESIKDPASKNVWDMEMEDTADSTTRPLYYGDFTIFREVTRV